MQEKNLTNLKQIYLTFIGAIFIGMAIYLKKFEIWHELVLILGWVPIWEAIHIELFKDSNQRKRRCLLRKLLISEIVVKKETK